MSDTEHCKQMIAWTALEKDQQTQLLQEYGYYLDSLPPTCDIEEKEQRFRRWLSEKNISY